LLLLFLIVPLVEIYLVIQVGASIGVWETIALLILISVVGAWLVRREGLGVLARVQQQVAAGQMPTNELVDGMLILFAGALMLTPGFLTDGVGVLCLLPPTRAVIRRVLVSRFRGRVSVVGTAASGVGYAAGYRSRRQQDSDVFDVRDLGDVDHTPVDPDELEP
jgi:UPF0716 protein FxsA